MKQLVLEELEKWKNKLAKCSLICMVCGCSILKCLYIYSYVNLEKLCFKYMELRIMVCHGTSFDPFTICMLYSYIFNGEVIDNL